MNYQYLTQNERHALRLQDEAGLLETITAQAQRIRDAEATPMGEADIAHAAETIHFAVCWIQEIQNR